MRKTIVCIVAVLFLGLAVPLLAQETGGRRIREHQDPVYPELARQMNLANTVVRLQVTIMPSGSVRDIKVLGGHPLLADAATKAVQGWKWDPGHEETKTLMINFK